MAINNLRNIVITNIFIQHTTEDSIKEHQGWVYEQDTYGSKVTVSWQIIHKLSKKYLVHDEHNGLWPASLSFVCNHQTVF